MMINNSGLLFLGHSVYTHVHYSQHLDVDAHTW